MVSGLFKGSVLRFTYIMFNIYMIHPSKGITERAHWYYYLLYNSFMNKKL
jgi:hypothetical protein